ncbi:MAG: 50S ribosomal protein L6 [Deltaproteobacteria bacterium]
MSRIGKLPIALPNGVKISVSESNLVTVKGKLGELRQQVDPKITLKIERPIGIPSKWIIGAIVPVWI